MTQDYVRTTRQSRKRKPTSRAAAGRRPAPPAFPLVRVVLAAVLVIGFGIFLYVLKGSADDPQPSGKVAPVVKPIPIEEQRPAKEKFDYMALLENKEVNVDLPSGATPTDLSIDPEQRKRLLAQQQLLEQQRLKAQQLSGILTTPDGQPAPAGTVAPKLSEPERAAALLAGQIVPFASSESKPAASAVPTNASNSGRVMMQCGAFRSADQAASMKLRLSQQGQAAQVQQTQLATGTWHKVVLGPFSSRAEAERKKSELQARHMVDSCTLWNK